MSFYSHRRCLSLLRSLLVLSVLVSFFFFYDLKTKTSQSTINEEALPDNLNVTPDNDYPPDYKNLRKWIHDLPQHNLSLPFPEGKDGRYVKFSSQVQQLGWNNLLNSVCVIAFPPRYPNGDFNF